MRSLLLCLLLFLFAFSCKKKADETPTLTVAAPPAVTQQITAKINGTAAGCNNCYSASQSGGIREANFALNSNDELIRFFCTTLPAAGTYTLSKATNYPSMIYQKNNVYYKAVSGTLNISSIDTIQGGLISKLSATFNFDTDTTAGVSYHVSEGALNLN